MKEFTFKINDKNGLHARPAGVIVTASKSYESEITIECEGKVASAKRLLSLMSLGATYGKELNVSISGKDEEKAYEAIKHVLEEKLG